MINLQSEKSSLMLPVIYSDFRDKWRYNENHFWVCLRWSCESIKWHYRTVSNVYITELNRRSRSIIFDAKFCESERSDQTFSFMYNNWWTLMLINGGHDSSPEDKFARVAYIFIQSAFTGFYTQASFRFRQYNQKFEWIIRQWMYKSIIITFPTKEKGRRRECTLISRWESVYPSGAVTDSTVRHQSRCITYINIITSLDVWH